MTSVAQMLKQALVQEIEKLPPYRLQEVLDFVRFLQSRPLDPLSIEHIPPEELDPAKDPILQFIGGVVHGSLAQAIDEGLYGP
jgi:hypothetical protein